MASTSYPSTENSFNYDIINGAWNITNGTKSLDLNYNNTQDTQILFAIITSIQTIAFMVMVTVCSILGTLGNIAVLLVYCTKTERRTANTFIKVLAVIDLVVCAVIMPYSIIMELHLITSDIICRFFEFVRHVSIGASNMTLAAIAIERYVAVCVIGHRMTVHNVNQGMFVVVGISILVAVPSMGLFAVVTKDEVKQVNCMFPHIFNANFSFCHFTTSLLGPVLSTAYQAVLMIFFFITFLVIVILYTIVYWSLWKRAKRRASMPTFAIDMDVHSSSEKRMPSHPSDQDSDQEKQESQCHEEPTLFNEREVSECSASEHVSRLGASGELYSWLKNKDISSHTMSTRVRRVTKRKMIQHRRTARMLFLCSVVFLVTWLPFWVDVFNRTHNLCLRYLFFVGNASNPIVYGIANSQFRKSLIKLIMSFRPRCNYCKHL